MLVYQKKKKKKLLVGYNADLSKTGHEIHQKLLVSLSISFSFYLHHYLPVQYKFMSSSSKRIFIRD